MAYIWNVSLAEPQLTSANGKQNSVHLRQKELCCRLQSQIHKENNAGAQISDFKHSVHKLMFVVIDSHY